MTVINLKGKEDASSPAVKNPWLSEETGYSLNECYCKSKDDQGHSTTHRVRFPDHVAAHMSIMIASGEIPEWRTIPDLIRDAVVHRLQYMAKTKGTRQLTDVAQIVLMQGELDRASNYYDEIESLNQAATSTVRKAIMVGDRKEAAEIIENTKTNIETRFGDEKSEKILKIFNDRMASLLAEMETETVRAENPTKR